MPRVAVSHNIPVSGARVYPEYASQQFVCALAYAHLKKHRKLA